MSCVDTPRGVVTTYLAGTPINEVAVAPDGTIWAVGGYDGDTVARTASLTNASPPLTAYAATTATT